MNKVYYNLLKDLFNNVLIKMSEDGDFSKEIEQIFDSYFNGIKTKGFAETGHRRTNRKPAIFNPIDYLIDNNDMEKLEQKLNEFSIEELKDIVSDFGMDHLKLVLKWKNKEKIIKHIVFTTYSRVNKGKEFRYS